MDLNNVIFIEIAKHLNKPFQASISDSIIMVHRHDDTFPRSAEFIGSIRLEGTKIVVRRVNHTGSRRDLRLSRINLADPDCFMTVIKFITAPAPGGLGAGLQNQF